MKTCILCSYQPHIYEYASILSKKEGYDIKLVATTPNTINWKNYYFPKVKSYDFFDLLNIYHCKDLEIKKAPKYIIDDVNTKTMLKRNLVELFPSENLKIKIINSYFTYWDKIFKEIQPKNLIFEEEPHQLIHYICYLIAKKRNLDIQMFIRTIDCTNLGLLWVNTYEKNSKILDPKFFKTIRLKKISAQKAQVINKIANLNRKEILKLHLQDQIIVGDKESKDNLRKTSEKKFNFLSKLTKLPKHDIISNIKIPYSINPYVAYLLRKTGNIQKKINYKYYESVSKKNIIDFKKKNIILLLQYQPEKSTCPLGGEFCDQLKLIKFIQQNMGEEYNLLVKEHPSQFSPNYSRSYEKSRSKAFYMEINALEKTFLIPLFFDIFSLPKDTIYISVTGTVILESSLRGFPSICLGYRWFSNMPYIQDVKNYKELKKLFKNLNLVRKNTDKEKSLEYFKNVISAINNEAIIGGQIRSYPENIDFYKEKGSKLYKVFKAFQKIK